MRSILCLNHEWWPESPLWNTCLERFSLSRAVLGWKFSLPWIKTTHFIKHFFADLVFWTFPSFFGGLGFFLFSRGLSSGVKRYWTDNPVIVWEMSPKTGLLSLKWMLLYKWEVSSFATWKCCSCTPEVQWGQVSGSTFPWLLTEVPVSTAIMCTSVQQEQGWAYIFILMRHSHRHSGAFKYPFTIRGPLQVHV